MKFGENDLEKIFVSGGSQGTYTPDSTGADVDGPVVYESEDIEYDVANEFTDLHGDAIIDYTNVNLTAGFINVAWRNNLLKALPESKRDTTYGRIRPSMVEAGEEPMVGDTMVYNLETRHGKVIHGKTKAQDGVLVTARRSAIKVWMYSISMMLLIPPASSMNPIFILRAKT